MRVALHVFGPVHRGGAEGVGGGAGEDQHLLDGEALDDRLPVDDQRQPDPGAVVGGSRVAGRLEAGDVEVAVLQQRHVVRLVGGGVAGAVPLAGDELVEILVALVVAAITATVRPSAARETVAPTCLNRPSAV